METVEKKCECAECQKREEEAKMQEEMHFAVLVALTPMLALTIFSNLGLF